MSAKSKTILKGFDYMHCDDFARLLNDMAAKGWHFKEWGVGLKFEKGKPENATYAVEVFNKASENDTRPEPHTQEFAEYCEVAGWKLVDAKQKFCIFKKVDENAVELFTPEERVANSFKAMTSGWAILLLVLYGMNAFLQWINIFSGFERNIFSGVFLFTFSTWNVMFLGQLCTFIYAFFKRYRLMNDVKKGKEVYIGSNRDGKFHLNMRDVYILLLLLLLTFYLSLMGRMELILMNVFIIVMSWIFAVVIAKIRPESNVNLILQVGFSLVLMATIVIFTIVALFTNGENTSLKKDEFPLLISDYREYTEEIEDMDSYRDANFLGSVDSYFIFGKEESIYYRIYKTSNTMILDRIWEEELDARYNEGAVDCTTDWEAQKALRNKIGTYYVRYENSIFIFNDDEDIYLTEEQIDIICDKMDLR